VTGEHRPRLTDEPLPEAIAVRAVNVELAPRKENGSDPLKDQVFRPDHDLLLVLEEHGRMRVAIRLAQQKDRVVANDRHTPVRDVLG
jgi:hypothetical protein